MTAAAAAIEIWLVELDDEAVPRETVRQTHDRRRAAAHRALRALLVPHVGVAAANAPLHRSPMGKPSLAAGEPRFSLSHSGGRALIAIRHGAEIGIDLEAPRQVLMGDDRRALIVAAARAVADGESVGEGLEDPVVLRAWVRLEAVAKATGEGMGRLLTRFGVIGSRADLEASGLEPIDLSQRRPLGCRAFDLSLDRGFAAAVAGPCLDAPPPVQHYPG